MRKKTIFNVFLSIFVLLFTSFLLLFLTFPKFIFVDKLLERNKFFLISERVYEDFFKVILNKGKVFYSNKEALRFDVAKLEIKPFYLFVSLLCEGNAMNLKVYPSGELVFSSDGYTCIKDLGEIKGDLVLKGKIRGRLELKNLRVRGFNIDKVALNFRGIRFDGVILYGGMELKGSGTIKLSKNFFSSRIDGSFKGAGITLKIFGSLNNLRVRVR
ncbi:hypothetical protein [Aquifex sp.]